MLSTSFQRYLDQLRERLAPLRDGRVADDIPEFSQVDPDGFGIALEDCEPPQPIDSPPFYAIMRYLLARNNRWTLCAVGMGVAFLHYWPTLVALVSRAASASWYPAVHVESPLHAS